MEDKYPDSLPPFPKPKKYRINYIHQWVTFFKNGYHFDKGAIPVLLVKELNKKFKCVELVPIYKLLLEHMQYAKDNNLMRNAVPTLHSLAHLEKLKAYDDKSSSSKKSSQVDVSSVRSGSQEDGEEWT